MENKKPMKEPISRFVRTVDSEGKEYVRLYLGESFAGVEISEVEVKGDSILPPPVTGKGNLYSYKRLQREKEKSFNDGWQEGYREGMEELQTDYERKLEQLKEEFERKSEQLEEESYQKALTELTEKQQLELKQQKKSKGTVKGKEGRKPALSNEKQDQVKALRELGKSYREIGVMFGISHQTVKNIVKGR